jgi:hypothetical protein
LRSNCKSAGNPTPGRDRGTVADEALRGAAASAAVEGTLFTEATTAELSSPISL